MGKITSQSVAEATMKVNDTEKTKPITSYAHIKDTFSNQTYFKN